jgi:hypothetical protein
MDNITKKEYFVGLAMQALITREPYSTHPHTIHINRISPFYIAEEAIQIADEILKQLEENEV